MTETWLRSNVRPWQVLAVPLAVSVAVGAWLLLPAIRGDSVGIAAICGAALSVCGLIGLLAIAPRLWRPRVALRGNELLVYTRGMLGGRPARVPIGVVECFLLSEGASMLPGRLGRMTASTIVIRIAERAEPWLRGETNPRFGTWCGGYITLRGAWCEPLSVDLARRLNALLAAAHQRSRVAEHAGAGESAS